MSPKAAALALALLLVAPTGAAGPDGGVAALGDRVADWHLANLDRLEGVRTFEGETRDPRAWIQAAFFIGLERWSRDKGGSGYRDALRRHAERNDWRIGDRYWHADDQAIAQLYLALENPRIDAAHAAFDRVLADDPRDGLSFEADPSGRAEGACQRRWCWCDALFMAPPAWAAMSRVTGDPRYADYALAEYEAVREVLLDPEFSLFYRDSRFFDRRTPHGNKVFWSRGNGWVFAGLPLLLEQLPGDHAARPRLLELFVAMAGRFRAIQADSGLWAPSLLDFAHDPQPETSGSGFIAFGLQWGVNRGVLEAEVYQPVIERAWSALAGAVDDDGRLGWVQQVGNAPDEVRREDTQFYGAGAFLLAASERLASGRD